jgi:hypothetical protein
MDIGAQLSSFLIMGNFESVACYPQLLIFKVGLTTSEASRNRRSQERETKQDNRCYIVPVTLLFVGMLGTF